MQSWFSGSVQSANGSFVNVSVGLANENEIKKRSENLILLQGLGVIL